MSTSTIGEMNEKRVLGGKSNRERVAAGRKIDWIFKQDSTELGCGEAAKSNDPTKMLLDGGFKMPKVMKSMFSSLSESASDRTKDLKIHGFLVTRECLCLSMFVNHLTVHDL